MFLHRSILERRAKSRLTSSAAIFSQVTYALVRSLFKNCAFLVIHRFIAPFSKTCYLANNCVRHGLLQNHVRLCTLGFVSSRAFLVLHLNITLFTSSKIAPSLLSIDLSRLSPRRAIWRITVAEPFPQNSHVRFSTLLPVKTTLSCSSSQYYTFHKEKGFSSQYYTFHYLSIALI